MPRNSIGVYTPPSSTWNPATPATPISTTDWNALLSDLADALTGSLSADGSTPATALFTFPYGLAGNLTGNITGNAATATFATSAGTATNATNATTAATATNALACSGNSATATLAATATNALACSGNSATATSATNATNASNATYAANGVAGFLINTLTGARVISGTATNSGRISWGTAAPGTLDVGEIYLQYV